MPGHIAVNVVGNNNAGAVSIKQMISALSKNIASKAVEPLKGNVDHVKKSLTSYVYNSLGKLDETRLRGLYDAFYDGIKEKQDLSDAENKLIQSVGNWAGSGLTKDINTILNYRRSPHSGANRFGLLSRYAAPPLQAALSYGLSAMLHDECSENPAIASYITLCAVLGVVNGVIAGTPMKNSNTDNKAKICAGVGLSYASGAAAIFASSCAASLSAGVGVMAGVGSLGIAGSLALFGINYDPGIDLGETQENRKAKLGQLGKILAGEITLEVSGTKVEYSAWEGVVFGKYNRKDGMDVVVCHEL